MYVPFPYQNRISLIFGRKYFLIGSSISKIYKRVISIVATPEELANGLLSTNDKSSLTRSNDLKYVSPDDS